MLLPDFEEIQRKGECQRWPEDGHGEIIKCWQRELPGNPESVPSLCLDAYSIVCSKKIK